MKRSAPLFYTTPTPAQLQKQVARSVSQELTNTNTATPVPFGHDDNDDVDPVFVKRNEMCFSGCGGGGGGSMWYCVVDLQGRVLRQELEGPALVKYLSRTGAQYPYRCSTSPPYYRYNRATGYFELYEPPSTAVPKASTFWHNVRVFLGISSSSIVVKSRTHD